MAASEVTPSQKHDDSVVDVEQGPPVEEQEQEQEEERDWTFFVRLLGYGLLYVSLSGVLIFMNKYLMTHGRFPYALPLVTLHQFGITLFSTILYLIFPRMYPTMPQVWKQKWLTLRTIFPLSVCCAASFVASNLAYKYVSVALLQILKECNIAGISWPCSPASNSGTGKSPSYASPGFHHSTVRRRPCLTVLLCIVCFTAAAVTGDIHYIWFTERFISPFRINESYGIVIQLVSQLFECGKIIIMQFTMSDRPSAVMKRLDPLTAVGLMAPLAFILLIINCGIFWNDNWLPGIAQWKWVLIVNVCVAYGLNLAVMKFIQVSTGVHFVLCGILKDFCIVMISAAAFHEPLTAFQYSMFGLSTIFILLHSVMTHFDKEFTKGWIYGFKSFFKQCIRRKTNKYKEMSGSSHSSSETDNLVGKEVSA